MRLERKGNVFVFDKIERSWTDKIERSWTEKVSSVVIYLLRLKNERKNLYIHTVWMVQVLILMTVRDTVPCTVVYCNST